MKKILYLIMGFALLLASCDKDEAALTPSGADKLPLAEQPDLTKELIAQYNSDYGVKIVYEFDEAADFRFAMKDKNVVNNLNNITIKQFPEERVDFGLELLDQMLLQFFKSEVEFQGETIESDFIANYFPKHLFIVDSIGTSDYYAYGDYIREPDNYEKYGTYFSYLSNSYEPAFAFNFDVLDGLADYKLNKYRNSMLYCFLSSLFIDKGVINELPSELFDPVADLYSTSVNELAEEEEPEQNVKYGRYYYYVPDWYIEKGFALTNTSPSINTRVYGTSTVYDYNLRTTYNLVFPDKERDLRNLIHVIIYETSVSNIQNYYLTSEVFTARMKLLVEEMYQRGIDVFAINPAIEEFFN